METAVKWEYSAAQIREMDLGYVEIPLLNSFGAGGWELVSVDDGFAYFKRPVHSKSEAEILKHFDAPRQDRESLV